MIGIDEAQFFGDLYDFCREVADHDGKTVIVAGLDGDYLRYISSSPLLVFNDFVPILMLFSRVAHYLILVVFHESIYYSLPLKFNEVPVDSGINVHRRSFGSVLDIIPLADSVTKLSAQCEICGKRASSSP